MSESRKVAQMICEDLITRSGDALVSGDFTASVDCYHLPQIMETFQGQHEIRNINDLRNIFDDMRAGFRRLGVKELDRCCVDAVFVDEQTIEATYVTRLLYNNILLKRPYPVFSVIKRIDGVWKITHGKYAVDGFSEVLPMAIVA